MQLTAQQRASLNDVVVLRAHLARTGLTYSGQAVWTDAEVLALRSTWPDRRAATAALPNRTVTAIEKKAWKLGLPVRPLHQWTGAEAVRLRRLWPRASKRELLEAFPWANWTILANQAQWQRKNGFPSLARPKTLPTPTGDFLVDAIIEQAVLHNMSLRDLDHLAGTGRYFSAGRHRRRRTWKHVQKAVELFGGSLRAAFPVTRHPNKDGH